MERKLVGFLLTLIGIAGIIMAQINILEMISSQSYGNNLYNVGDSSSAGIAVLGYGAAGIVFIFLGIKKLRGPSQA